MNSIKYIFVFCALILIGCGNDHKESRIPIPSKVGSEVITLSKEQFKNAKMEIGTLTEELFAKTVHTNGTIDVPPQNMAVINAFYGGYIKSTSLLVGDKVRKGERLVTLENPEFISMQQDYLETTEQLSYLKSEYERQKTMLAENITSQKSFLKAESEYKMAVGRSNSLKKNLQMLNINPNSVLEGNIVSQVNIYSPIDGYVTKIFINTGSYVSPADRIMEIMNTDHIHLELKIFEKDLMEIKTGQDILFKVPEASQKVFKGNVHLVGTTIDSKSRSAMIHGHIDDKDESNFTAGMFVEADIVTGTTSNLALPEDSVVEVEGKNYVLLIENEDTAGYELHPIEVTIGANYNGFTNFETELPVEGKYLTKGGFVLLQAEESGLD